MQIVCLSFCLSLGAAGLQRHRQLQGSHGLSVHDPLQLSHALQAVVLAHLLQPYAHLHSLRRDRDQHRRASPVGKRGETFCLRLFHRNGTEAAESARTRSACSPNASKSWPSRSAKIRCASFACSLSMRSKLLDEDHPITQQERSINRTRQQ